MQTPSLVRRSSLFLSRRLAAGVLLLGFGAAITARSEAADTVPPSIASFSAQPVSYATVPVTWSVTDSGGSFLNQVEVWSAPYSTSGCDDGDRSACAWTRAALASTPPGLNSWSGTIAVLPAPAGVHWLRLHVSDGMGQTAVSPNPLKVHKLRAPAPDRSAAITKRVLVVIYDPVLRNGQKLHVARSWGDPRAIVDRVLLSLQQASGGFLNHQIVQTIERNEWPLKMDGFRYNEDTYDFCMNSSNRAVDCHSPDTFDYNRMFVDLGIEPRVRSGEIDEVIIVGAPYFGPDEFAFKIPGDAVPHNWPTNDWLYSLRRYNIPDCGKTLFVMGYSYEVGIDNAVHSYGHRAESALALTLGRGYWDGCPGNATLGASDFDHFTCTAGAARPTFPVTVAGCGDVHSPHNASGGYDYGNRNVASTACPSWFSYPFTAKTVDSYSCATWGCDQIGYLEYWFGHMPHSDGRTSGGNLRNWWKYIGDFDRAVQEANSNASFSGLSSTLAANQAQFRFSYSGSTPGYHVDLSTSASMSTDVYLDFATGAGSPLSVGSPQARWDKYRCGKTLYWRVWNQNRTVSSPIQTASTFSCSTWNCANSSYNGAQYWTCSGNTRNKCSSTGVPTTQTCGRGCYARPLGQDDLCISAASGWNCANSAYGGKQWWTCSGGSLYKCDGSGGVRVACPAGCNVKPLGTNDTCK